MLTAHRAALLHFVADPEQYSTEEAHQHFPDGLLVLEDGKVKTAGDAATLLPELPAGTRVIEHENALITPGFIDTHTHYPQIGIIGAHGRQLLEWLEDYTFPTEAKFSDAVHAREVADTFLDELLRAGTTTALVFGTVHPASVDAFFEACEQRDLRMIAGKVMMDRNAPEELRDTAESSYRESKALIEKWHNRGRLRYAVTPRFAPTSTPEQLARAGDLLREYPDVYLHTHMSESLNEVAWVGELFPDRDHYLHTYDHAGLLGRRSIFAHCIHMTDNEWERLAESGSGIAFCPTSNLFLGSGLFSLERAEEHKINVGLGTDVGGGTSFSILQTLNEAYKVAQMRGEQMTPFKGFYLATLGGAKTLDLQDVIGNFEPGKEADFVVLDKTCTPLMTYRLARCRDLFEELFVLCMLGDDRLIAETWSGGRKVHDRDKSMEAGIEG